MNFRIQMKWLSASVGLIFLQIIYSDERTRLSSDHESCIRVSPWLRKTSRNGDFSTNTHIPGLLTSLCAATLRGGGRKSRVRKPRIGRLRLNHLKKLKPKGDSKDLTRGFSATRNRDMDHYDHGDGAWQV
jgi:hypothetical protein